MHIRYHTDISISVDQFLQILSDSGLDERRPVENRDKISKMIDHADIIVTAWDEDLLVGVSRAISDFSFCTYLSDLAVHRNYQRQGIGKHLIELTREISGKDVNLFLFSAPLAVDYYPKVGFESKEAFILFGKTS